MAVINTNVNAIIARNAGAVNERSMTNAMQQLSTGKRINVAADDAAGLAISTKMTSQIRGLDQAVRNANDGISMLQVVEGATVEMTNMLQRMRELAVQSANDTNTAAERSYLDDEYQELLSEIDRIANTTQWNGQNVMDGTGAVGAAATTADGGLDVSYQVGANASQTIDFNIVNFATDTSGSTAATTSITIDATDLTDELNAIEIDGNLVQIAAADLLTTATDEAVSAATNTEWDAFASVIQTAVRNLGGYDEFTVTAEPGYKLSFSQPTGDNFTIKLGSYNTTGPAIAAPAGGSTTLYSQTSTDGVAGTATSNGIFSSTNSAQISGTDITSTSNATTAITTVDNALKELNAQRSAIGATINRLTYAADNLTNTSANVMAARSRVLDTDYAQATTELARTQIIQQASTAMLAQANQGAQSVLSLLK